MGGTPALSKPATGTYIYILIYMVSLLHADIASFLGLLTRCRKLAVASSSFRIFFYDSSFSPVTIGGCKYLDHKEGTRGAHMPRCPRSGPHAT